MEKNCYSFLELSIGRHRGAEGIIIEQCGSEYHYAYSERGNKSIIKSFDTESELVQYALDRLSENEWNRAHIVAMTFDINEISEAEKRLADLKISFRRNDVPNFKVGMTAYRIFVFGTDILGLDGFKKKYLHALR